MVLGEMLYMLGITVDQKTINKANSQVKSFKSGLMKLLGAIGIGISLKQLNALADEFHDINDQITYAQKGMGNIKGIQNGVLQAANDCRVSYAEMTNSVLELQKSNKDLFPIQEATEFVEYINKLGQASRYSEGQTRQMQKSLEDVFTVGQLGLEELTRMAQDTPELIEKIAEGIGVSTEELEKMAVAGQLTADTIKESFLKSKDSIDEAFSQLDYKISDSLLHIRNRWGFFIGDINDSLKITDSLARFMTKAFDTIMNKLEHARDGLLTFTKYIGGTENLFRLLAMTAGAFFLVMNWPKIVKGAKMFFDLFSFGNLKILAIVAAVLLLALVVEDFIGFMNGKDSVLGDVFESMGISAEEGREMIINAWNNVVGFLTGVWETLRTAGGMFIDTIVGLVDEHGAQIWADFQRYWGLVSEYLNGIWTFISQLAQTLFGSTEDSAEGAAGAADTFLGAWQGVLDAFSVYVGATLDTISTLFNAIADVVEFVFNHIKEFWAEWGPTVLGALKIVFESCGDAFMAFLDVVKGVANLISALVHGDFKAAFFALGDILDAAGVILLSVLRSIFTVFYTIAQINITTVKNLIISAFSAVRDFLVNIWNSIVSYLSGVWNSITASASNGMSNIRNTISSILHAILGFFKSIFSNILSAVTGKMSEITGAIRSGFESAVSYIKGLIGQAYSWGADLIGNIGQGISDNVKKVTGPLNEAAGMIKGLLGHSVPTEGPLKDELTWMPDMMTNLARGIKSNRFMVKDAVGKVAGDLNVMANAKFVSGTTAGAVNNTISNKRSVNQSVEITNQFYGDRAIQQKASSAMNRSAQDVTSQLARGLAFAR